MGKTIAEKILSKHAGKNIKANDIAVCKVDLCYSQDGTSTLVIDSFKDLYKKTDLSFPDYHMIIDHSAPSPSQGVSKIHRKMRDFCSSKGAICHDVGEGVCHEVMAIESNVLPGRLICGADSHTCTLGAIGAFATGMGSTDIALILATGENWFRVPESIKINFKGSLEKGVLAKDVILHIIDIFKADGATYNCLEYHGESIENLSMDARFTICNMSVEVGAKAGIFMPDKITLDWLDGRYNDKKNDIDLEICYPDKDAIYSNEFTVNLSDIEPKIAKPHRVDNVVNVADVSDVLVDQVYIGTCTNGRLEDLKIVADILKNNKVHAETRLIVAPASNQIYINALRKGIIETIVKSGGCVVAPGCGPCVGTHNGIPSDGENVLSTANRNFKGRMGNPNAFIYLSSPATAAASCITGKITDPRQFL